MKFLLRSTFKLRLIHIWNIILQNIYFRRKKNTLKNHTCELKLTHFPSTSLFHNLTYIPILRHQKSICKYVCRQHSKLPCLPTSMLKVRNGGIRWGHPHTPEDNFCFCPNPQPSGWPSFKTVLGTRVHLCSCWIFCRHFSIWNLKTKTGAVFKLE